ncbi:MAG: B12-binding domain-containing radical SAM protein [Gemmatimonadales bacterium]|nr:MAG: B12-binding domain-containing radical SAM protein [Gemmatimonadales bacterium]
MRILLIDPVTTARSLPVEERRRLRQGIGYPGLGLLTVAALTPRDIEVRVIDESVEEIPSEWDPDLVGISVQAPTAPYAYELAQRYRSNGVPVVLGGIHTSLNPDEAQAHADAIVLGEAEATWPTLVDDFRRGAMSRRYCANRLVDLNASPEPRRDLLRAEDYRIPWVVQGSKGCPFGCEFCSLYAYVGMQTRLLRIDGVVDEIRRMPGDMVLFADDNLYADRAWALELFHALRPVGRQWIAEATWHIAEDEQALDLAAESGCVGLFVGLDSLTRQSHMTKVPRQSAEERYVAAIRAIQHRGIAVVAAFVFGLDDDGPDVFERALNVVREGGANLVNFSVLVPYPGTPIHRRLRAEGRITEWDWSKYISPNVCFIPKGMSADELASGTRWCQEQFYSLGNVVKGAVQAAYRLGWAMGIVSLKLNLAQRRNWGKGSSDAEAAHA